MSSSTVQESCSDAIASVCVHVWVPMGVCVRAWVCFDPHFPDRCHFQLILLFMVNEPIMHIAAAAPLINLLRAQPLSIPQGFIANKVNI